MLPSSLLCLSLVFAADAADIDRKYPLDAQLRVLADDVKSARYRELVTKKMLVTDLAAEWQRVATADNPESFLDKHGGKDKVLADPELKQAYERRVQIRNDFLELMREGYKRYKQVPPFDKGVKAEVAGTQTKEVAAGKLALSVVPPVANAAGQWPRFRGPSGQGWTDAKQLPVHWSKDSSNIVWRSPIPGQGNSSPIIWGERIFVTSSANEGAERWLHCFAAGDGKLLWSRQAPARPPEQGTRDKNGFASATPVTDGERVIAFLGSCGLLCYDFDGKLLWHYDELKFKTTHGTASCPLLYKDLVIFVHDQNQLDSIFLALDKKTGKVVWQQKRPRAMTWSSPVVAHVGDHDELLFAGNETVKGYDPSTGEELWSLKGPTNEVVPTLVIGPELIYSASGRNGPTIALLPGGKGDVTESRLAWRTVRGGPHVPSPILIGQRLYTINDTGVALCLNAQTGKVIWQERISDLFSASPIECGGLLYFAAESGIVYVLRAADKFELVAKNDMGAAILASPAVIGDRIIWRTQAGLVCVGAGGK